MCAIVGAYRLPESGNASVLPLVRRMLYAQSNRGRDGWGESPLIFRKGIPTGKFKLRLSRKAADSDPALIYRRRRPHPGFDSPAALGHVRWATSGAIHEKNSQPVQNDPEGRLPPQLRFSMAFNGNIANVDDLRAELEKENIDLKGANDTEVLMRLIESVMKRETDDGRRDADYEKIFREVERRIDGGCSLVLLDGKGDMIMYRNAPGIRPLEFMKTNDGLLLAASESCAFEGFEGEMRTVPPGEIVWYNRHRNQCEFRFVGEVASRLEPAKLDIMEPLYFQAATSRIYQRSNRATRKAIGRALADYIASIIENLSPEDRRNVRIVPIPNTAIPYAEGLFEELLERGLVPPNALVHGIETKIKGRAFQADNETRMDFLKRKYWVDEDAVRGKIVIPVDDTWVRGDASGVIIKKLKDAGAAQVHWAVGSPPIIGSDYYGIATPLLEGLAFWKIWMGSTPEERKQLYSQQDNEPAIINFDLYQEKLAHSTGANSVTFLPLPALKAALEGDPESYNYSCVTRSYPTDAGQKLSNDNFRLLQLNAA